MPRISAPVACPFTSPTEAARHYRAIRARLLGPVNPPVPVMPARRKWTRRKPVPAGPPTWTTPTVVETFEAPAVATDVERIGLVLGRLPARPPVRVVVACVAEAWGLSSTDLLARSKKARCLHPRMIAMALARHVCRLSLFEIGRRMGGRDHTTVRHSVVRFGWMIEHAMEVHESLTGDSDSQHPGDVSPISNP